MTSGQTSAESSGGSAASRAPAPLGAAGRSRFLRAISPAECFDLLEPGGIGRVGFTAQDSVIMLPVNFSLSGRTIIFRTAPDTLLALHANAHLSFEVDHFDAERQEGWSVLVQGHAHQVTDEREVRHLEDGTHLQAWAPGARDVYVRIAPTHVSGRSIQRS
jgi:nitroimidazol reductase NimA-like FMN-containing flavoprotein (pyridoxamine 5'-phosphate oxidase superfamily)